MSDKQIILRVFHIPQVPMKAFTVDVESVEEAAKVMQILVNYDLFQFKNNIKPDYCNVCFLQMWDSEENEYIDWYHEDDKGNYFDDVHEYLESVGITIPKIC